MTGISKRKIENAHISGLHQDDPVDECHLCVEAERLAYAKNLGFHSTKEYENYMLMKFRKGWS